MSIDNGKELFGVRVWNVAKQHNISMTNVQNVVNEFVSECRKVVIGGRVLRLFELVTITPNKLTDEYAPTLGYICSEVSTYTGVTYHTVFAVINAYLLTVREEVLNKRSADIRRLVSFHCILLPDDLVEQDFKVNCCMSSSLRSDVRNSYVVDSARVSMSKFLRNRIKEGVV